jgi:hypothetical protein|tara:strand:- start:1299 stop:1598 length:300 start_codon:yes stop_codon:yes gene_type:complete
MKLKSTGINEFRNLNIFYQTKDEFITCKLIVYGVIENNKFEVNDIELEFFLLDKMVKRKAFKELYEKLFGIDSYEIYCNKLYDLAGETAKDEFNNGKFK